MKYNNQTTTNQKPERKSIKLKDYDYSLPGLYYITLCAYEKKHLFGWVKEEKMILNQAGKLLEKWLLKIETKFDGIKCIHRQVMPNHFHGIIKIFDKTNEKENIHAGSPHGGSPTSIEAGSFSQRENTPRSAFFLTPHRPSPTLFDVVGWFKTMTTNEYIKHVKKDGWQRFNTKLWQRSFYEHIIKDEEEYEHAVLYIKRNPERWADDEYHN